MILENLMFLSTARLARGLFFLLYFHFLWAERVSLDCQIQRTRQNSWEDSEENREADCTLLQEMERQLSLEYANSWNKSDPGIAKQKIFLPSFVLKKRDFANQYHEILSWEIAYLLDCKKYQLPSYLALIDGDFMTLQPYRYYYRVKNVMELPDCHRYMALKDFWMGNIMLYLLGASDITSANIGYDMEDYHPIYFDLEYSFAISNDFKMIPKQFFETIKYDFECAFYPRNLAGPLFSQKLRKRDLLLLRQFQQDLKRRVLPKVQAYLRDNSYLGEDQKRAFLERLDKIIEAPLKQGLSFKRFLTYLYPSLPPSYFQSIQKIANLLGWQDLGFGGTMLWFMQLQGTWTRDPETYRQINRILDDLYLDMNK
jgi:hypothetical protein